MKLPVSLAPLLAATLTACSPTNEVQPPTKPEPPVPAHVVTAKPAPTNQVATVNNNDARAMLTKASVPTFPNTEDLLVTTREKLANAAQEIYKLSQANNHQAAIALADKTLQVTFNSQLFGVISEEPNHLYMHLAKAYSASVTGASFDKVKELYDTAISEAYKGCRGNNKEFNAMAESLFINAVNYANHSNHPELIAAGSAWAIKMGFVLDRMKNPVQ